MNGLTKKSENLPDFVIAANGPTGLEQIDNECIAIPFLRLAQANTPQVQPGDNNIEGLQAGMYFSPSLGRIYGAEAKFIALGFYRCYNVWEGDPPDSRYVMQVSVDEFNSTYREKTHKDANGKIVDSDGLRYMDTRNMFLMSEAHPEDGVLFYPMSVTAIPASRKWLAKVSAIRFYDPDGHVATAAIWSRLWQPKISFVRGKRGTYFQAIDVVDCGWIPDNLAPIARDAFMEAQAYVAARDKLAVVGEENE